MSRKLGLLAVVVGVATLALVGVLRDINTSKALIPYPVQPFLADADGGMADTTLGLINVETYTITTIPRGSRTTLPWIYSGPGFELDIDKNMPTGTDLGSVFSYVDALCNSPAPGVVDILEQLDAGLCVAPPIPLRWLETTTAVEGTGSEFLKSIVPPYSWLARHTANITNICLLGIIPFPTSSVLNTVYTSVPFSPNGSASTATTKLGGDPSKPPTATCLDSPQDSISITSLYRAPKPEGDIDGVCDTGSQACADAGIYGMWTDNSVTIPNGGARPINVDKRKVNNGPEAGDFEELWEVESTNLGIMAEWVGHGPVFAEDISLPVGVSVEQDKVLSITCTAPADNQWGLVVLKNILSPIPPTEDTYLDDNAFTFVVLVKCGTPVVLPEVDKEVIWIKTAPNHVAIPTGGTASVAIDELKANHATTDAPGLEWLVAEVGDVVSPAGPDLGLAWVGGVTVTAPGKTTQAPPVIGVGTPSITFPVNEWPGQADVNATLNITCPATTPPGLYPVVVKAIDVPVGAFESKPSDNAQRKVITVRCGGAAPSGGEDANGLYARWTVFQSDPDDRKAFQSPPSFPSDTGYVERIVDLQCYWMDHDGCFKDAANTVPCNDDGNGWIDEQESWEDWDLQQLGGIDAVDKDRDCLMNAAYAQPSHPVDLLDVPRTGAGSTCDPVPYSQEPNIVIYNRAADEDCDGLVDGVERAWGSNPLLADSDSDGATDFVEMFQFTNPLNPDTDGDGILDKPEDDYIAAALPALQCANNWDDDGDRKVNDGCPASNAAETNVTPTFYCNNNTDDDGDTVVNDGCPVAGTPAIAEGSANSGETGEAANLDDNCPGVYNPGQENNDGQGRPNGNDIPGTWASNPNQDKMGNACDPDDDNDALPDTNEATALSDPFKLDSDGDTFNDGAEVINGTDPLLKTSYPAWGIVQQLYYRGCHHNLPAAGTYGPYTIWDAEYDSPPPPYVAGSNDAEMDVDGDGILCGAGGDADSDNGTGTGTAAPLEIVDSVEAFGYGTAITNKDTDGDGLGDWDEICDVNGDGQVNIVDILLISTPASDPVSIAIQDIDKNGVVNGSDVSLCLRSAPPAGLSLSPVSATNLIYKSHTVTAIISPAAAGVLVTFSVSGANAGAAGTCSPNANCTTNAAGSVSFTYTGVEPGDDTISASAEGVDPVTVHATWALPHGGIIFPVAGGSVGDGIPGTSAALSDLHGLTIAPDGALIIADSNHHRIRRIAPSPGPPVGDGNVDGDLDEVITTIAGNGVAGFTGHGGPARNASLSWPVDVAFDSSGNLYIADTNNHAIRMVSPSPGGDHNIDGDADEIITTIAGNGTPGLCTDNAPATGACLNAPEGVDIDASGNVFIADIYNLRIAKVTPAGTISTVAGTVGITGGVKVDSSGNLYIADWYNHMVRKINVSGVMTTIAGNGTSAYCGDGSPATAFCVDPSYLYVNDAGQVWIAEQGNQRVRLLIGNTISTVAGNGVRTGSIDGPGGNPADDLNDGGPATATSFAEPSGAVLDASGAMFIADRNNSRVRRVDSTTGYISTIAGTGLPEFCGDGHPAVASSCLNDPADVATDSAGNLYIADTHNNRIRRVDAITAAITTVAGGGPGCVEPCPATQQALSSPSGVAVDASGNIYIADPYNNRVRKVTGTTITTVAGGGPGCVEPCPATQQALNLPSDVDTDASGNIYIVDNGNNRIRKVTGTTITTVAGGGPGCVEPCPATQQALNWPTSVAVHASAGIYIADRWNYRVRRVDPITGNISTVAGTGAPGLSPDNTLATSAPLSPVSVEVDADGHLLISEQGSSHRVRVVTRELDDAAGIVDGGPEERIYTIAGGGSPTPGFCGDPDLGPPVVTHNGRQACLNTPAGITYDDVNASLYIADQANQRIRKLPSDCDLDGLMDAVESGVANNSTEKCDADTDDDGYNDPQASMPGKTNVDQNQDNCPLIYNPDQLNTDASRRPNGSTIPGDWASNPTQDTWGDVCDTDHDNDWMLDTGTHPVTGVLGEDVGCGSGPTNPLLADTDGDTIIDGAECALGSDPNDSTSKPALASPDKDGDGLPASLDNLLCPSDVDGDGLVGDNDPDCDSPQGVVEFTDGREFRKYGTDPSVVDTDGDICADWIEIVDLDGNRVVNINDVFIVASRAFPPTADPAEKALCDLDGNGTVNINDVYSAAQNSGLVKAHSPCGSEG